MTAPEFFFFCGEGGMEGAKSDSEGAYIQKFAENGFVWPFCLLTGEGGKWGEQSLRLWGEMSLCPPRCRH